MKLRYYIIVSICTIFLFDYILKAQENNINIKEIEKSIVRIITYNDKGNKEDEGFGIFISDDGKIITNDIFYNAYSAEVITSLGKYDKVEILFEDEEKMYSIAKINARGTIPLFVSKDTNYFIDKRIYLVKILNDTLRVVEDNFIYGIIKSEDGQFYNLITYTDLRYVDKIFFFDEKGFLIDIDYYSLEPGLYGGIKEYIMFNNQSINGFIERYKKESAIGNTKIKKLKQAKERIWYKVIINLVLSLVFLALFILLALGVLLVIFALNDFVIQTTKNFIKKLKNRMDNKYF